MATAGKPPKRPKGKKKNKWAVNDTGDLMSMPIVPQNTTYKMVRTAPIRAITATATGQAGVVSFSLDDLSNIADFTTLFDVYRIDAVEVRFEPGTGTLVAEAGASPIDDPMLITVIDYDDSTVITDESALRDYGSCIVKRASVTTVRRLRPKFARAVYNSPTSSGYGEGRGWLDMASTHVPHYGVKYYLLPTSLSVKVRIILKFFLSFRWVR